VRVHCDGHPASRWCAGPPARRWLHTRTRVAEPRRERDLRHRGGHVYLGGDPARNPDRRRHGHPVLRRARPTIIGTSVRYWISGRRCARRSAGRPVSASSTRPAPANPSTPSLAGANRRPHRVGGGRRRVHRHRGRRCRRDPLSVLAGAAAAVGVRRRAGGSTVPPAKNGGHKSRRHRRTRSPQQSPPRSTRPAYGSTRPGIKSDVHQQPMG
jgi:hypothetical protein